MSDRSAILLLAHGTPERLEEIPEYLSNVTGGRGLPDTVIAEITRHYGLIGRSPLTDITMEQARLLSQSLSLPVYFGMRNWRPYIADTVREMQAAGITRAVAICMAPQNSRTSVGLYQRALSLACGEAIAFSFVESWSDHRLLITAFAEKLGLALQRVRSESLGQHQKPTPIIFTAHSVPCRTVQGDKPDPYCTQSKQTAAAVAQACGLDDKEWFFAFQSQGASGGPWIGPTVEETLVGLQQEGNQAVVIQPVGFVCDHVEVLYDIDIALQDRARDLGLRLSRTESLNTSPGLIAALDDISRVHLKESQTAPLRTKGEPLSIGHAR